jgi:hypothetical protein
VSSHRGLGVIEVKVFEGDAAENILTLNREAQPQDTQPRPASTPGPSQRNESLNQLLLKR